MLLNMIDNCVDYSQEPELEKLVNDYNALETAVKKPNDWESEAYTKLKSYIKKHYIGEQNYTCCYCKQKILTSNNGNWDIEHIIPRALRPDFMFEEKNLCISCKECNGSKSDTNVLKNKNLKRFPSKPSQYLIVHPHFHEYEEHIDILVEDVFYRPISQEGVFTIVNCGLLRFYKYINKDFLKDSDPLSFAFAKRIAFSDTNDKREEAEKEFLIYLKLKHV